MKLTTVIQNIALLAITTVSPAVAAAADDCAGLGGKYELDLARLPATIDTSNIRTCKEHPNGNATAVLSKRDCFYNAPYGCHDNYCWKQCGVEGSGQWCWTATNGGFGPWIGCSQDSQCNAQQDCGVGPADCGRCGCSC